LERWRYFRSQSPIYHMLDRLRHPGATSPVITRWLDGKPVLFLENYVSNSHRSLDDILKHPNYASLKEVFGGMKNLATAKHLEIKVVAVPSKEEVYSWVLDGSTHEGPSTFAQAMGQLSGQQGFDFVDLGPELTSEARKTYQDSGRLFWWRGDSHWNTLGQKHAADIIFRHIQH